jgi:hypothetical protein
MPPLYDGISPYNRSEFPAMRKALEANMPIYWTAKMYALAANYLFFMQKPQFG